MKKGIIVLVDIRKVIGKQKPFRNKSIQEIHDENSKNYSWVEPR
jgi:hypothetical protein